MAAPLISQAKTDFYVFLYGNLRPQNIIFELCLCPLLIRVRYSVKQQPELYLKVHLFIKHLVRHLCRQSEC